MFKQHLWRYLIVDPP